MDSDTKKAYEILAELREKYKDDEEALDILKNGEKDIEYLEEQIKNKDYKGQTPLQSMLEGKSFLEYWY